MRPDPEDHVDHFLDLLDRCKALVIYHPELVMGDQSIRDTLDRV
jgi:hypothetical protein